MALAQVLAMLARRTALLLTPPDLVDSADTALLFTPPLVNPADTALLSTSPLQDSGLSAARLSSSRALSPHRGQGETEAEKAASAQSADGGEEDIGPREGSEAHDQEKGAGEHGGTGSGEDEGVHPRSSRTMRPCRRSLCPPFSPCLSENIVATTEKNSEK